MDRCTGYWAVLVVANGTALTSAALGAELWPAAVAALSGAVSAASGTVTVTPPPSPTGTGGGDVNGSAGAGSDGGDRLASHAPTIIGATVGSVVGVTLLVVAIVVTRTHGRRAPCCARAGARPPLARAVIGVPQAVVALVSVSQQRRTIHDVPVRTFVHSPLQVGLRGKAAAHNRFRDVVPGSSAAKS